MQLEVVFEMDQGNVSAKFKGKSDSYNEQRQHTQVAENPRGDRKSGLQPRISALVFSEFKSNQTFLEPFKTKNRSPTAKF